MKITLDPINWSLINSAVEKRGAQIENSANGNKDVTPQDDEPATKNKETTTISSVTTPVSSDNDRTHSTGKSRSATTTKEDHPTTTTQSGMVYINRDAVFARAKILIYLTN